VLHQGRSYKVYRAMVDVGHARATATATSSRGEGALEARAGRRRRARAAPRRLNSVYRRSAESARHGLIGAGDLEALRQRAQFVRITAAGCESHPHDVIIPKSRPTTGPGK
jgi:IMP dehydrogenase